MLRITLLALATGLLSGALAKGDGASSAWCVLENESSTRCKVGWAWAEKPPGTGEVQRFDPNNGEWLTVDTLSSIMKGVSSESVDGRAIYRVRACEAGGSKCINSSAFWAPVFPSSTEDVPDVVVTERGTVFGVTKGIPYPNLVEQLNVYELIRTIEAVNPTQLPALSSPSIQGGDWRSLDASLHKQYESFRSPTPRSQTPVSRQPREHIDEVPEEERAEFRAKSLRFGMAEETAIEYTPKKVKHTIYVFVDVLCKHCQQLVLKDIPELLKRGIRVRFLAMPLAGPNSEEAKLMANIWCSPNKHLDLESALKGKPVAPRKCDTPVVPLHYALARRLGIDGSPGIVTEGGDHIGGYLTPAEVLSKLESPKLSAPTPIGHIWTPPHRQAFGE